jgi:hypothetical protein
MRDTWVDLDVGDADEAVTDPIAHEQTGVYRRAEPTDVYRSGERSASRTAERTDEYPRADTAGPTTTFARPTSMYPLASADHDDSTPLTPTSDADADADVDADADARAPSNPHLDPTTTEFDREAVVHRFDTMPPVNAQTRMVAHVRLVKRTEKPALPAPRTLRRAM